MTVRMNLWSLTLLPGEPVPLYVRRDFQITNAALGEELRSADGRSVVKVTHNPIPPGAFDSDSEYDSDEDDEELSGSEDDEEAELEEEEDDEELDEDELAELEGMDDDDSDDEDMIEETSVLCSLTAGKIEQATLDLTFVEGEVVIFEVTGENAVHLMGNYVNQWPTEESDGEDDDSECDSHDDFDELDLDEQDEFSVDDFDGAEIAPKGKIVNIDEMIAEKLLKKGGEKKRKAESESDEEEEEEKPVELTKAQKKKLAKKAKLEAAAAAPAAPAAAPAPPKEKKEESNKKTLPSGLVIEDIKVGTGPGAKPGKRLGMRYVGKLMNGKQFDANTGGAPFRFVLGRGEVISGWDQGLVGMKVGGERRLTIPAKLAYGNQKIPGIPANSTLKFEVKLVSIN